MKATYAVLAAVVLLLGGCASYDSGYRDGAYYRPSDSGDGDYYYGRPQRQRDYNTPFYSPYYYGPYGYPYYAPYRYPYYGPYRGYRSGYGLQYNFGGYGGYGGYGYGYPTFGLSYTHISRGDRHHDRDRDRDRHHGRDADHLRNDRRDDDHRRDSQYGAWRLEGDRNTARPWRPAGDANRVLPQYRQGDRYSQAASRERVRIGDARRERNIESAPQRTEFRRDRDRAQAQRTPRGGNPMADLRRAEPRSGNRQDRVAMPQSASEGRQQARPEARSPGRYEAHESRYESQKRKFPLEKE